MKRIARGDPTGLPNRYAVYLVARAYGVSPAAVREWPADDFREAAAMLAAGG